jgi:hypothetical protein
VLYDKKDSLTTMKTTQFVLRTFALSLLLIGALAQAATVTGTVTNKTTGKPAVGDTVELVDVQAGMRTAAHATTDGSGHYSLSEPGSGPYLVRAMHQGAGYFIAAPQGSGPGNITVYDVAAKVQGVSIEADVMEAEAANGQLQVTERYFVHNTSSPPVTQWSAHSFEIVLPAEAIVDGAEAQRPSGLPTSIKLDPYGAKGHYAFNFPIQPDNGEKDTLFQLVYHVPYSSGKFTFSKSQVSLPADNVAVLLPKSMTFTPGAGAAFKTVPGDPGVQTLLARNVAAGKAVEFTISGKGSMPREDQGAGAGQQAGAGMGAQENGGQDTGTVGAQPGGGIGNPINTPDPLSKYKGWILGGLGLLLVVAAAFLLRKPAPGTSYDAGVATAQAIASPAAKHAALLNALKEELFTVESEKISGTITPEEYAKVKAALETVLRRALNKK